MHQSTDPASNVFNVYIGYNAGHVIPETGCYGNIGIGHQSMYNNKKGQSNIAMGVNTLYNITTAANCVILGPTAGLNISSATGVMGIGSNSCRDITTGSYNTGIGFSTCRYMKEGPYNIGIGYFAGAGDAGNLTGGSYNISIGTNSGLALADGASNNTFIGPSAGKLVTTGSFNVLIGVNVEPTAPTSSYKLNIGDLIFGDLAVTKRAGINQSAPWAVLHVTGLQSNTTYRAIVRIDDDAGQAEGVGGGILFGYKHTDAGGSTYGPGIRAYKENSTSGNTEAGLRLLTRGVSGLVQAMSISSDGDVTIDGQIRQAIAWDDQQVDIGSVGLGSSAPTWVAYKGGKVLSFSATQDNGINFTSQLTHKYAQGEDIEFHIHLAYPDANVGNSKWTLTYSWANIGVAFPTETSVSKVISSALLTDGHQLGELVATIDGTGKNISSALICSLTREGTDGTDTYASATYLVALDFHVPVNSIGSDQESSKV